MRPPPRYTPPGYPEFGHTSCNSPAECASEVFLDVDGALIDAVDIDAELGKRRARQCDDVPAGAVTVEFSWVGGLERREDSRRPTRQRPLYTNPIEVHFGPLRQLTLANSRARKGRPLGRTRPKQFGTVATRYDKRGYVFLGTVTAPHSSSGSARDRGDKALGVPELVPDLGELLEAG
jgi:hypothetical protein